MIWALLVGNTRAVAGLMKGNRVLDRIVTPTQSLRTASGANSFGKSLRKRAAVEGLAVASVVPPVDRALRKSLGRIFGIIPFFVQSKSSGFIRLDVEKPSQAGADRIANAAAARELYGAPVIVVDFGTGTTFDVVDKKGSYAGGAILPGLGISLRALHDYTAKIPLVPFAPARRAVGRTTEKAVRSGVYHGALGASRELLIRIRKELGKKAPAVATGGWGGVFKNSGLFDKVEPDLTLIGISLLWRERHAKH